jgi:predicted ArsR family transcriptional regulator
MTSAWDFGNTAAGRVVKAIRLRGKARITDVADDLGVTASAVRQHLTQLEACGVVHADKVREGVGRPHYVYSVTPEAHNLFYQDYGDLARLLLDEVIRVEGSEALPDVVRRLGRRLAELYRDEVEGRDLAERVKAWADLLDERGVIVEVDEAGEGYVVDQYGCPYLNLAVENRAVCEMERQVMAQLLGAGVRLERCTLDGHRSCRFKVEE